MFGQVSQALAPRPECLERETLTAVVADIKGDLARGLLRGNLQCYRLHRCRCGRLRICRHDWFLPWHRTRWRQVVAPATPLKYLAEVFSQRLTPPPRVS